MNQISRQIPPGQKLTLGNYLQCNRRTKPDQNPKPIPTQGNYPLGYLGQKASVTTTIVSNVGNVSIVRSVSSVSIVSIVCDSKNKKFLHIGIIEKEKALFHSFQISA